MHEVRVDLVDLGEVREEADAAVDGVRALAVDPDLLAHGLADRPETEDDDPVRAALGRVEDRVELAAEEVEVLPVDRGHEGAVELLVEEVGELVALVLDPPHALRDLELVLGVLRLAELGEAVRSLLDVLCDRLEVGEELVLAGEQEAHDPVEQHAGTSSGRDPTVATIRVEERPPDTGRASHRRVEVTARLEFKSVTSHRSAL